MVTTVATTELVTEESNKTDPLNQVTEDSTPPGDNFESISVSLSSTEEPADSTTDLLSADNSNINLNNNTVPSTGGGRNQKAIIVVVVIAIVVLVVVSILVSVLAGILFKKRTHKDSVTTSINFQVGIENPMYVN